MSRHPQTYRPRPPARLGAVLGVAVLLGALASLGLTGAAGAGAATATSSVPARIVKVDLRAARLAARSHLKQGRISGITYARGKAPKRASGRDTCAEPDCPLVWGGGPVQYQPHVYLLLWGPLWTTDTGEEQSANYLGSFYSGLGVTPQDDWSSITSQYGDGTGFPTFGSSVFMGTFDDGSTPPMFVSETQLAEEADAFAINQGISDLSDAQIVVATQSGTCPDQFYAPGCAGGSGSYCAYHALSNEPFVNLPYLPDAGSACGANDIDGPDDGFSIVGGHEYAETITDPDAGDAWIDLNDPGGGEIGDKCAWNGLGNVTLSTGTFAMQPLYSNAAYASSGAGCVLSAPPGSGNPTTTKLHLVPASPVSGQPIAVDVTVSPKAGGPIPSGEALVSDGTDHCRAPLSASGSVAVGSCKLTEFSSGPYRISAHYPGDTVYAASVGAVSFTVGEAPTSTTLSVTGSPAAWGSERHLHFSATVHPKYLGTATGVVTVGAPGATLCVIQLVAGRGSCSPASGRAAPSGTFSAKATYESDGNYAVSTGITTVHVLAPPGGYYLAGRDGTVLAAGTARPLPGFSTPAADPVVGIAVTPDVRGWLAVTADGVVHAAGDATWRGDLLHPPGGAPAVHVSDIVAIAATTDGRGYWLIGSDGGMFAFGSARYHGSLPGIGLRVHDVVGMVAAPSGAGYLIVAGDGGVFAFGATRFYGSLPAVGLRVTDIRAILPAPGGTGYVLVGSDGGFFAFGHGAPFEGSLPGRGHRVDDVVGIALTPDGVGYWMAEANGTVWSFGDAAALALGDDSGAVPVAAIGSP